MGDRAQCRIRARSEEGVLMEKPELSQYIDHTLLKADATPRDIERIVAEGKMWGVAAVCINSGYVRLARQIVGNDRLRVVGTVGFPLGQMSFRAKLSEASIAIEEGAHELDVVWNLGRFLAGDFSMVQNEIKAIAKICGETKTLLKVILETAVLSREQIKIGTQLVVDTGANMVKTSTGFGFGGATEMAVQTMRKTAPKSVGIKAAGGIRTKEVAEKYILLGATRLGTSSTRQILGNL